MGDLKLRRCQKLLFTAAGFILVLSIFLAIKIIGINREREVYEKLYMDNMFSTVEKLRYNSVGLRDSLNEIVSLKSIDTKHAIQIKQYSEAASRSYLNLKTNIITNPIYSNNNIEISLDDLFYASSCYISNLELEVCSTPGSISLDSSKEKKIRDIIDLYCDVIELLNRYSEDPKEQYNAANQAIKILQSITEIFAKHKFNIINI